MDYKTYAEKKSIGLAELVKAGGGYALAFKRWDENTGEQKEPEIQAVDLDELTSKKQELADEIKDIETLEADVNTLKLNIK